MPLTAIVVLATPQIRGALCFNRLWIKRAGVLATPQFGVLSTGLDRLRPHNEVLATPRFGVLSTVRLDVVDQLDPPLSPDGISSDLYRRIDPVHYH